MNRVNGVFLLVLLSSGILAVLLLNSPASDAPVPPPQDIEAADAWPSADRSSPRAGALESPQDGGGTSTESNCPEQKTDHKQPGNIVDPWEGIRTNPADSHLAATLYMEFTQATDRLAGEIEGLLAAGQVMEAYNILIKVQRPGNADDQLQKLVRCMALSFLPAVARADSSLQPKVSQLLADEILEGNDPDRIHAAMAAVTGACSFYLVGIGQLHGLTMGWATPPRHDDSTNRLQSRMGLMDRVDSDRRIHDRIRSFVEERSELRLARAGMLALAAFEDDRDWPLLQEEGTTRDTGERCMAATAAARYSYSLVRPFLLECVLDAQPPTIRKDAWAAVLSHSRRGVSAKADLVDQLVADTDPMCFRVVMDEILNQTADRDSAIEFAAAYLSHPKTDTAIAAVQNIVAEKKTDLFPLVRAALERAAFSRSFRDDIRAEIDAVLAEKPTIREIRIAEVQAAIIRLLETSRPESGSDARREFQAQLDSLGRAYSDLVSRESD